MKWTFTDDIWTTTYDDWINYLGKIRKLIKCPYCHDGLYLNKMKFDTDGPEPYAQQVYTHHCENKIRLIM